MGIFVGLLRVGMENKEFSKDSETKLNRRHTHARVTDKNCWRIYYCCRCLGGENSFLYATPTLYPYVTCDTRVYKITVSLNLLPNNEKVLRLMIGFISLKVPLNLQNFFFQIHCDRNKLTDGKSPKWWRIFRTAVSQY